MPTIGTEPDMLPSGFHRMSGFYLFNADEFHLRRAID